MVDFTPELTPREVKTYASLRDYATCVASLLRVEDPVSNELVDKVGSTVTGWWTEGWGCSRIVFSRIRRRGGDSRWVFKIPLCGKGETDNYREARYYKRGDGRMAKCRLVVIGGLDCLVMEKVDTHDPIPYGYGTPEWAKYVDCCQVGRSRSGEIVAYDYADGPP
jgi:hypothetical protein